MWIFLPKEIQLFSEPLLAWNICLWMYRGLRATSRDTVTTVFLGGGGRRLMCKFELRCVGALRLKFSQRKKYTQPLWWECCSRTCWWNGPHQTVAIHWETLKGNKGHYSWYIYRSFGSAKWDPSRRVVWWGWDLRRGGLHRSLTPHFAPTTFSYKKNGAVPYFWLGFFLTLRFFSFYEPKSTKADFFLKFCPIICHYFYGLGWVLFALPSPVCMLWNSKCPGDL